LHVSLKYHKMKHYKHIFIDLDRTLWDFEANSMETFREIYKKRDLAKIFTNFEQFHKTYRKYNRQLWEDYRDGKISKENLKYKRFYLTLAAYNYKDEDLAKKIGDDYIQISATKTQLFPYTHESLEYLLKKYSLHLITNGFEEVQYKKIKNCHLEKYFKNIITSEKAGVQKPNEQIFNFALKKAGAKSTESIMLGDDIEGDIKGAQSFGMDQILFNPDKKEFDIKPTYEIQSLKELIKIL